MASVAPLATADGFTDAELAEISRSFETASASQIIRWAVDNFAPHLCLTASMTDAVLVDLAWKVYEPIEVVFIDTGYHFPETLETVEKVRRKYGSSGALDARRSLSVEPGCAGPSCLATIHSSSVPVASAPVDRNPSPGSAGCR